jgi:hypothetical protein
MSQIKNLITKELTEDDLKNLPPGIFAYGKIENSPEGVYMARTNLGEMLIWAAVRGDIADWTIYVARVGNGLIEDQALATASFGDKVHTNSYIRKLVPCTDEAFKRYRY